MPQQILGAAQLGPRFPANAHVQHDEIGSRRVKRRNLRFHLLTRLKSCRANQRQVVVDRQMRREQGEIGQRERTVGEMIERHGKAFRRPCGGNSPIRRTARQTKLTRAVGIERREPLREIELSRVELREGRHQHRRRRAFAVHENADFGEELLVGEQPERVNHRFHRPPFSRFLPPHCSFRANCA